LISKRFPVQIGSAKSFLLPGNAIEIMWLRGFYSMSEGAVEPRGGITLHCLGDVRIESHLVVIVEWRRRLALYFS
jgi:hypothetical protein